MPGNLPFGGLFYWYAVFALKLFIAIKPIPNVRLFDLLLHNLCKPIGQGRLSTHANHGALYLVPINHVLGCFASIT